MFSSRVPGDLSPNPLAAAVERMRLTGRAFADLTVSNPTEAGSFIRELAKTVGTEMEKQGLLG